MRALKVVEQVAEPEIAEAESWSGRLQMALLAPNGVQKLRKLIFELATQGALSGYTKEMNEYALLGEVCTFVMGQAPPGSACNKNGEGTIFVKTGEFGSLYPEIKEWTTKPLKFAKSGDVLICVVGATVGKINLGIDCAIGRSVAAIRPSKHLDTKYLYYALMPFTLKLRSQSRGSAQGVIGKLELNAVRIWVPNIKVQKDVVKRIDELMALCDTLEAQKENAASAHETLVKTLLGTLTQSQDAKEFQENWQRIAQNFNILFTTEASIDALKQTVLQLAVMGKLVPQSPKDESADKLLEHIKSEKQKLEKSGTTSKRRSNFVTDNTEVFFDIPKNWAWTTLSEISSLVTDGEHLTPERTSDTTQIPLATAKNVRDGYLDLSNTDFVPKNVAEKCWKRCKPEKSDILIVSVGATTGRLSVCRESIDMVIVRSVTLIRPSLVDVDFLALTLNSPYLQKQIWRGVKQNAQPCLYLSASKNLPIPLPPLSEQKRIVTKVKDLIDFCDTLKDRLIEFNSIHEQLATALVEKAVAA